MAIFATRDMTEYLSTRPRILLGQTLVKTSDLRRDYAAWAKSNKRAAPKPVSIGMAFRSIYPKVEPIQLRVNGQRERFYRHQTPFLPPEPDDLDDLL